jgi:hypothetical protein
VAGKGAGRRGRRSRSRVQSGSNGLRGAGEPPAWSTLASASRQSQPAAAVSGLRSSCLCGGGATQPEPGSRHSREMRRKTAEANENGVRSSECPGSESPPGTRAPTRPARPQPRALRKHRHVGHFVLGSSPSCSRGRPDDDLPGIASDVGSVRGLDLAPPSSSGATRRARGRLLVTWRYADAVLPRLQTS